MNGIEAIVFDLGNVLLAYDEARAELTKLGVSPI